MKKIVIILISLIFIVFFSISYLVSNNNNYIEELEEEIKENYNLKSEIKYLNKFNFYYIIVTSKNLIVLDNEYQEVFKENVGKIKSLKNGREIVYRLNQVMYEDKEVLESKIIYKYYDIYSGELIDTVEIGG